MEPQQIRRYIREYLELIENDSRPVSENEELLPRLLDQLALAQNFVDLKCDPEEYPDPPRYEYQMLRAGVYTRFPKYGYYNMPTRVTEEIAQCGLMVGDAIDDITDIARDLYDVEWRFENTSELDAMWNFKNDYIIHLWEHMRCLQMYLAFKK